MDIDALSALLCLHRQDRFSVARFTALVERGRRSGGTEWIKLVESRPELKPERGRARDWLDPCDHHIVFRGEPDYPPLLDEISQPPSLLYVCGDPSALRARQIAIVGARQASAVGSDIAEDFATQLASHGFAITSGLARGIDSAAHRGALTSGGTTVAVLGCGIDVKYPRRNLALKRHIERHGVVISEFPLGAQPLPFHFPRRNRLISGLGLGVLVVEARLASGSLSTANHALEQGREVFAIPGPIRSPLSRGTHALIKQGAKLVESLQDIVEEFAPSGTIANRSSAIAKKEACELERAAARVLSACDYEATPFDYIVERSGLTVAEVSSILLALEFDGFVRSTAGGCFIRGDG